MSANPIFMPAPKQLAGPELSPEAILVRDTLIEHGLETPMIETGLTAEQKYERIRDLMDDVVRTLGLDLGIQEGACHSGCDPYRQLPLLLVPL